MLLIRLPTPSNDLPEAVLTEAIRLVELSGFSTKFEIESVSPTTVTATITFAPNASPVKKAPAPTRTKAARAVIAAYIVKKCMDMPDHPGMAAHREQAMLDLALAIGDLGRLSQNALGATRAAEKKNTVEERALAIAGPLCARSRASLNSFVPILRNALVADGITREPRTVEKWLRKWVAAGRLPQFVITAST